MFCDHYPIDARTTPQRLNTPCLTASRHAIAGNQGTVVQFSNREQARRRASRRGAPARPSGADQHCSHNLDDQAATAMSVLENTSGTGYSPST